MEGIDAAVLLVDFRLSYDESQLMLPLMHYR